MMKFWRCLAGYNAAIAACTAVTEKVAAFNGILEAHKTTPKQSVGDIKQQARKALRHCTSVSRK